jgi:hypothetical protein
VSSEESYEQAAICYRRAGWDLEAARCYRLAGAHRRAAEIYEAAGRLNEAAAAYGEAGLPDLGAWLLAHRVGDPARARAFLDWEAWDQAWVQAAPGLTRRGMVNRAFARAADGAGLRERLILARCEVAEGTPASVIRPVIADVCELLANRDVRPDPVVEEWAVALSEAAARYDQAALVFAAAVRGGRHGAAQRWNAWSTRVLDAEVILPTTAA